MQRKEDQRRLQDGFPVLVERGRESEEGDGFHGDFRLAQPVMHTSLPPQRAGQARNIP